MILDDVFIFCLNDKVNIVKFCLELDLRKLWLVVYSGFECKEVKCKIMIFW